MVFLIGSSPCFPVIEDRKKTEPKKHEDESSTSKVVQGKLFEQDILEVDEHGFYTKWRATPGKISQNPSGETQTKVFNRV